MKRFLTIMKIGKILFWNEDNYNVDLHFFIDNSLFCNDVEIEKS